MILRYYFSQPQFQIKTMYVPAACDHNLIDTQIKSQDKIIAKSNPNNELRDFAEKLWMTTVLIIKKYYTPF